MRTYEINTDVTLVTETCVVCGVVFAMPEALDNRCKRKRGPNGQQFWCPNGHQLHFTGKSDSDRARELEAWLNDARTRNRGLQDQLEASERSKRAVRGHLTRIKNRVGNGVCPVCNRTFQNLHDHMHGQHPEFLEGDDE